MKKTLFAIAALLACTFSLSAQSSAEILSKIEKAQNGGKQIAASRFFELRSSADRTVQPVKLEGKLSYTPADNLQMNYDNGELFSIEGNKMTIRRDGTEQVFDTAKNLMMKGLSHALLYMFQGRLNNLATEQNADIAATKEGSEYVVTITARKKAARGYSRTIIRYDARNCSLRNMQMDEFSGASTYYSFI